MCLHNSYRIYENDLPFVFAGLTESVMHAWSFVSAHRLDQGVVHSLMHGKAETDYSYFQSIT